MLAEATSRTQWKALTRSTSVPLMKLLTVLPSSTGDDDHMSRTTRRRDSYSITIVAKSGLDTGQLNSRLDVTINVVDAEDPGKREAVPAGAADRPGGGCHAQR